MNDFRRGIGEGTRGASGTASRLSAHAYGQNETRNKSHPFFRMTALLLAFAAAGAMLITDIAGAAMVLLESRERGWLAGVCDGIGWLVSITCTKIAVRSHGVGEAEVLALVTCANVVGTRLGVATGKLLLRRFPAASEPDAMTVRAVRR